MFSFSNPNLHIPPLLSNLHVGYRHYQIHGKHVDCFTFGFWCNDLDVKIPAEVGTINEWEHWAGTFEFQQYQQHHHHHHHQCSPYYQHNLCYLSLVCHSVIDDYIRNGRLLSEDDSPAFIGRNCELAIGNRLVQSAASEGLKGGIADIRIWSRVLTPEQITALYECTERMNTKSNTISEMKEQQPQQQQRNTVSSSSSSSSSGGDAELSLRDGLEVWYKCDESENGFHVLSGSSTAILLLCILFNPIVLVC